MTEFYALSQRRAVNESDFPFLRSLYATTRAQEMAATGWHEQQKIFFLHSQFQLQHNHYQQQFPNAHFDIIVLNTMSVGRLYYGWENDDLRLIDIALLPEYQRKGIGNRLIRELMHRVAERKGKLILHVDINNPARNWYLRLGFIVSDNSQALINGIYQQLHWNATSLNASTLDNG